MGILKPRTAKVLIYHGDDMEHLAELKRAVVRAEAEAERASGGPLRLGDLVPTADEERAAYDAAVDEAAARAVEVELTALGSERWRTLLTEHPARVGEDGKPVEDDAQFGVNTETFPKALLLFRDEKKRTITGPELSDEDLREFIEDEVAGDFEELWVTAYWLNKATGVDPRLGKYSTATRMLAVN